MTLLDKKLDEFTAQFPGYKVIYISIIGSRLYGTNSENSDTDYKGIFIPTKESLLLKTDCEHYTFTTGDKDSKNGNEDIDLQLWSIHKFFNLLSRGDTGAMDLLFSMTGANEPLLSSAESNTIYTNREYFITTNMKAFIGYCIGQSQKYNIKGERYSELCSFIEDLTESSISIERLPVVGKYKYIKRIMAPGPRGSGDYKDIPYIEVLGRKFDVTLDRAYILEKLITLRDSYGNRVKQGTIDWKALSHSVRIIGEVKELLTTGAIDFPLYNRDYLKEVKAGKHELEDVLQLVAQHITEVDELLAVSTLPAKPDYKEIQHVLLNFFGNQ